MSEEVKMPLPGSLQEIVGALLFASETPMTTTELREAVKAVEPEEGENKEIFDVYHTCTSKEIDAALRGVEKALEVGGMGFKLVCAGGAYKLQTVPSCGRYVRAMLKMDRPSRLGRASLETLAIIAYRQPLTKSEVEDIRGVDVSANMKTLMDLQLIRLVGKSELPGHPFLYGTTPLFLEHFGLASLQQLNELDPTLQRSNPKKKAELYKRPPKPGEVEGNGQDGTPEEGQGKVEVEGQGHGGEVKGRGERSTAEDTPSNEGKGRGESSTAEDTLSNESREPKDEFDTPSDEVKGRGESSTAEDTPSNESREPKANRDELTGAPADGLYISDSSSEPSATDDDVPEQDVGLAIGGDDDLFIDDTPDEFDDEDDEDDEEESDGDESADDEDEEA